VTAADNHPLLVCRLECPGNLLAALDGWIPKHLDDSLVHAAVTSGANYEMVRDFEALPSALNNHGNRMVIYATSDLDGCLDWLDSPAIRGAIEDGVDRESQYPQLDGEPFIGNIYVVDAVAGSYDSDFIPGGWWYVERFVVPPHVEEVFNPWLAAQTDRLAKLEGSVRARSWTQYRDAPKRFPYDRYRSKGNRMVSVEFGRDPGWRSVVGTPAFTSALEASVGRWDASLPYVRRDLAVNIAIRNPGDA